MADEITLKTWAAATVAPVDDAVLQEVYTGDGGIISGATVTIKDANTLHITGGYGAICGREFQIFASDIPVVLSSSGNLNGRLYIHMDLSQSTNPIQLLTEVAASLTPCVQDADVNLTNGIFEINLATFTVGTSAISGLADVAPKLVGIESSDLTSIKAVGSTNATGSTITKGTYFYLNGTLCQAKADIAVNATFTLNTNYEVVTAGGLNSLNSALTANIVGSATTLSSTAYTFPSDGYVICSARGTDGFSAAVINDGNGVLFASPSVAGTSLANTFQMATYVKKGMSATGGKSGASSANNVVFVPLTTN